MYAAVSKNLDRFRTDFYKKNGFVVVKDLLLRSKVQTLIDRFVDIAEGNVQGNVMTVMKDIALLKAGKKGQEVVYKLQDWVYDDVLFEYCCLPEVKL